MQGFKGWLQIFEELPCRGSRHLWEWEEQLMEVAGGRFHVNIRQNFLTLTEWSGEWLSRGQCPGAMGQLPAGDAVDRSQSQNRVGLWSFLRPFPPVQLNSTGM